MVIAYALLSITKIATVATTTVTSNGVDTGGVVIAVVVGIVCTFVYVDATRSSKTVAAVSNIT